MTKTTFKKVVCVQKSSDFAHATEISECNLDELLQSLSPAEVIVRVTHAGINASDINFTSGRYFGFSEPPFDVGFEGIGVIEHVGGASTYKVGQPVMFINHGSFAQYKKLDSNLVIPVPSLDPKFLACLVGGLTGVLPLKYLVNLKPESTVLITAAAGGVGHFAVQYAVSKGCKVIGTCSTKEKSDFLKKLGCGRVINYKSEDLDAVLKKEYPQGVNVVFESVGGKTFDVCMKHLSVRGTLIVIGSISHYQDKSDKQSFDWSDKVSTSTLISKSLTVTSFFLGNYSDEIKETLPEVIKNVATGAFVSEIDVASESIDDISKAVEYLHSGKSKGKVIAKL